MIHRERVIMTLTLRYPKGTGTPFRLTGAALPAVSMTAVVLYSTLLGGLINISANRDLTVNAEELSLRAVQEAEVAMPAEVVHEDAVTILDGRFPKTYLNDNVDLLQKGEILSATIGTGSKRSMVYALSSDEEYTLVLMEDGTQGFVRNSALTGNLAEIFDSTDQTKWADKGNVIRSKPYADAEVIAEPAFNDEIHIIACNNMTYWKVTYGDVTGYMDHTTLMDEMYVEPEPEPVPVADPAPVRAAPMANPVWDGTVLTAWAGTIMGPSGKETYYNLNMSGVIALMQAAGYNYNYWVRADGVKMYGDYVMAACSFDIRPRGTIVETSLGTAICADTGTFAYTNPTQVDIAVNW